MTLGGQSIDLSALSADSVDARRTLAGALGAAEDDDPLAGPGPLEAARAGSWGDPETGGTVRGLTGRELLLGSSFHLAAGVGRPRNPERELGQGFERLSERLAGGAVDRTGHGAVLRSGAMSMRSPQGSRFHSDGGLE